MKYCLSSRQPKDILKKADEIFLAERDFEYLPILVEDYPDKLIIVQVQTGDEVDWDLLSQHADRICCCLANLSFVPLCKERNLKFYYQYKVTSYYELNGLIDLGVSYISIGIPLFFNLKQIAQRGIPIRAVPNQAYEPYIQHANGLHGQWIRPEDVEQYEEYISTLEFSADSPNEEATLFNIYAEKKNWIGNLSTLISNLNYKINNKTLVNEKELVSRRLSCRQACEENGTCHYCDSTFSLASTLYKRYRELNS